MIIFGIVNIINTCAISWKYILKFKLVKIYNRTILISDLIFNVNKFRDFVSLVFSFKLNPYIVRYYYRVYNQQITKVIRFFTLFTINLILVLVIMRGFIYLDLLNDDLYLNNFSWILLRVGISETICTHKNKIKNQLILNTLTNRLGIKNFSTKAFNNSTQINKLKSLAENLIGNTKVKDNHNKEISLKFRQWFAGITDGDGYIYVNKKGNVGFEMTLPSWDERVLRIIQNKFGGNVHARAGVKAVRYRTQNRETVINIINCLNGLIFNNIRLAQLHKACVALNIPIKDPVTPTIDSAYLSGLLDSDGTINFYIHKYKDTFRYQLTISIANKSRCNLEFLLNIGGKIYFDKTDKGCYFWKANSKLLHLNLYDYFLNFPPKTIKRHRTYLIKEFHELNDSKVYRDTNSLSMNYKMWERFLKKWNNQN
uniref:LAGLIDADG endonuclease n=1 Tax=Agaricus bitorquis TaxID=5343 RepID=UPI00279F7B99|nr:LAGLIDADG endonuclease [Agaricus bitorquis]WFG54052.1 LAGLIDADG endonuclease [Agaricus bitorquis]